MHKYQYRQRRQPSADSKQQRDTSHHPMLIAMACIAVVGILITSLLAHSPASAAVPEIKSGIEGYCLDVHDNSQALAAAVDSWSCNSTAAQNWTVLSGTIEHGDNLCLSVQDNGKARGTNIVVNPCNNAPGQVWLEDRGGFENPNSGLCLAVPGGQTETQLVVVGCNGLPQANEIWTPRALTSDAASNACENESKGDAIACYAEKEWTAWQSGSPNHEALLTTYTDGAPYEEWCADFVSYVYKEAGYPFTQGEADGWDESNANNIQNMGFTLHPAAGYTPQTGDVAYFNYPGGHVEIVVSGGKTPTFIYGNSATIDPTTGNGEMETNTITKDGSMGSVVYYLSPS